MKLLLFTLLSINVWKHLVIVSYLYLTFGNHVIDHIKKISATWRCKPVKPQWLLAIVSFLENFLTFRKSHQLVEVLVATDFCSAVELAWNIYCIYIYCKYPATYLLQKLFWLRRRHSNTAFIAARSGVMLSGHFLWYRTYHNDVIIFRYWADNYYLVN